MKAHTTGFKNAVKELGRQLRAVITYGNVTLEEEIYAVTPHFEGGILKSIMKQLDLELSVDIPLETVLNCQIGILVNGNYEMLNYGNYVVYKSEKQEDTNTYRLTCYDKMLYSMKQNEDLGIPYPISIKNYLIAICNKLGLTLGTTTFQNESRMIQEELYLGLDYTYRDILDEIAQATGSIICLNENDEVIVKYPTKTDDTIDEEFLKDVNADFGQMYGAINTIVLSRSGESDNIYYPETLPENPIEIKIKDNQIMNWNDRKDYLPGIYNALNGLYYYINDFSSTGILYYEVGDLYNVQVGDNTYQCLMLNDEINITTGIEEIIHTDLPEQSETDYTKADKTDRRLNQTYLIVDKQNQQIKSVVSQTIDPDNPNSMSNKLSQVTQTVSELSSQIKDIADITTSLESNSAKLQFEDVNQSEPIRVVIHPVGVNIAKLHPHTNLKPSINLVIKTRILRFENTTTNEIFDYELPDDLLYYDSENYDEFILDYESLSCVINKKCKWNNDGTVGLLPSERAVEYEFPHIELTEGDYTVSLIKYNNGYLFARMMIKNYYTAQFATRVELNSDIKQTVDDINLSVGKKLEGYSTTTEMNSAIDLKANAITQSVSETYATKETLTNNYSTIEQTSTMISNTVSSMTKDNIETVIVEYALGTSTTTAPTSGWSTTAPTWQQGKYMWQRTKTRTADGTENTSNPTCIAGARGQDGNDGISISSITEYYAVSSSNSSAPADSAFKTTMQTMTETNRYLWNYEVMTYSNGTTQKTIKRVIGTYGNKGADGTNGIGISSIVNKYQISTSNTTAPTSWSNTPPTMTATNKYLWNYEIITYSDNTTTTSTPAVIGVYGDKGQTGNTGKGVKGVVAEYYLSNSESTQSGGSWTTTQPTYKENHYYWTRTKITWTDDTVTYTTPILVQEINSLNKSVASLTIEAGKIKQRVDAIEDLTNEANGTKTVTLTNCVKGGVLELHIYGNNSVFQATYPTDTLYPQDNLYPKGDSLITVKYANNTTKTYELGVTEVLRKNGSVYDEYILESGQAKVIRRINSNGTVKTEPTIQNLGEFSIALEEGTNTITIKNYSADIYVKYAIKSAYTDIFATQVQMNSSITQTAQEINLEVSKKVDSNEVISKINQSAEAVGINANKINLSANDVLNLLSGNTINLSGKSIKIASNNFSVDENGKMTCSNANISGSITSNDATITGGKIKVKGGRYNTDLLRVEDTNGEYLSYLQPGAAGFVHMDSSYRIDIAATPSESIIDVVAEGRASTITDSYVKTQQVIQTSLESQKKNFEKYQNALKTLKNIDIYKYNLKGEQEGSKKHIGFVIGDKYNYSEEVTSKNNDGADIYSFVSLCCQAIKEQQEEIEKLRKEIEK